MRQITEVMDSIQNCGTRTIEFCNLTNGSFLTILESCNNRGCQQGHCQQHRGHLHIKNHECQVSTITKVVRSQKSFVFTGWVLAAPLSSHREFAQQQLIRLFTLLHRFAKTEFVIYMEFKLHSDGSAYLHFHVVAGSVGDIHLIESLWGRKVRYEYPIVSQDALLSYIRKYTAKSPQFDSYDIQQSYVELTYKLQMCRYSVPKDLEYFHPKSDFIPTSLLVAEMKSAAAHGRMRNKMGDIIDFDPLLDSPPDSSSDIPSCVYVFPTSKPVRLKRYQTQLQV